MLMAITGVALVLFIVSHLAGNLLVFAGPQALNAYAKGLRDYLPLLWTLRIGLIAAFIVHIAAGVRLSVLSRKARPQAYVKRKNRVTTTAAQTMILSGLVVLSFLIYHLAHFTFRLTHPEFAQLGEYDVYPMLIASFQSPWISGFYVVSILLLMMHLNHGMASFWQSLGVDSRRHATVMFISGPVLSTLLACGFIAIPVSIFFGFIS
jgi:succinate dehydrogenase / fumarate reductase cytochrome b subunit